MTAPAAARPPYGRRPGRGEPPRAAVHPSAATAIAAASVPKVVARPLPNGGLLGGFAGVCDQVRLESVFPAIREKFAGKVAEGNVAAAREAYEIVMMEREEASHA